MTDFTPITTQEDFDKAIKKRLAQKDRELAEQYRDYLAPDKVDALKEEHKKKIAELEATAKEAEQKISAFDKEKADLLSRATAAETSLLKGKVASKHKIPLELAERLVGDTEEALEKDAENFAGYMSPQPAPPAFTNDRLGSGGSNASTDAAYAALLASLSGEN